MFQDVLLFELFQRTLPNPFLFSFKFSRQNLHVHKKGDENSVKWKLSLSYLKELLK